MGNKVKMDFVTFAASRVSVVEDDSIKIQRFVKGLFEIQTRVHAKSGTVQLSIT
jgi:hypothetical protein